MDLDSQRTITAVLLLSDTKVADSNKVVMADTKEEEGMDTTLEEEEETREILTTVILTILVEVRVVKEVLIKVTEDVSIIPYFASTENFEETDRYSLFL